MSLNQLTTFFSRIEKCRTSLWPFTCLSSANRSRKWLSQITQFNFCGSFHSPGVVSSCFGWVTTFCFGCNTLSLLSSWSGLSFWFVEVANGEVCPLITKPSIFCSIMPVRMRKRMPTHERPTDLLVTSPTRTENSCFQDHTNGSVLTKPYFLFSCAVGHCPHSWCRVGSWNGEGGRGGVRVRTAKEEKINFTHIWTSGKPSTRRPPPQGSKVITCKPTQSAIKRSVAKGWMLLCGQCCVCFTSHSVQ